MVLRIDTIKVNEFACKIKYNQYTFLSYLILYSSKLHYIRKRFFVGKGLFLDRMSLKKDLNTMFNAEVLQGTVGPNEKETTGSSN